MGNNCYNVPLQMVLAPSSAMGETVSVGGAAGPIVSSSFYSHQPVTSNPVPTVTFISLSDLPVI
jgi:hypothetical protein